ncbi:hypothetical protein PR048_000160 [Dryococelus australis]|uniref:C2H2-type domain-containing protein n=1 Tax=Dryococelus australis TaxID=614101 RepID=A0ABQ9IDV2_9NEOP|nr:hypothetical protein PR048_000160 [Dryococelus australis]
MLVLVMFADVEYLATEVYHLRPYQCQKCCKRYSTRSNLQRHIKVECGQEPRFQCPYCPHRSNYKANLAMHIYRRHRLQ